MSYHFLFTLRFFSISHEKQTFRLDQVNFRGRIHRGLAKINFDFLNNIIRFQMRLNLDILASILNNTSHERDSQTY